MTTITKVLDGIEEGLCLLDRSELPENKNYLSFRIFYAPNGIEFPEGHYEAGWFCQIMDVMASDDEHAENGYIWVTGDPMGPEPTAADAAALAQSDWCVNDERTLKKMTADNLDVEMGWC